MFCTYIYFDPTDNTPRYVGEGVETRPFEHLKKSHNQELDRLLRKRQREGYDPQPRVIPAASKEDAQEMEKLLIAMIGRKDLGLGPLFNYTDGGDGCHGWVPSPAQQLQISNRCSSASRDWWATPGAKDAHGTRMRLLWAERRAVAASQPPKPVKRRYKIRGTRSASGKLAQNRPSVKAAKSAANRGRRWWNDGTKTKRTFECPGDGWVLGRLGGWTWNRGF